MVLIIILGLSTGMPHILKEEMGRGALATKLTAVLLVMAGFYLIS